MSASRAKRVFLAFLLLAFVFFCIVFYPYIAHTWKKIAKTNNHEYATTCFALAETAGLVSFLLTLLLVGYAFVAGYEWMIIAILPIIAYIAGGESFWKDLKQYKNSTFYSKTTLLR